MHPTQRNRRGAKTLLMAVLLVGGGALVARAEHRVALLIDNSDHTTQALATPKQDLEALSKALARWGVRCEVKRNLQTEYAIRDAIHAFAGATPTASTALVYFRGHVGRGKYKGQDGVVLVGTEARLDRGFPAAQVLEALSERGGSRLNLLILDAPKSLELEGDMPDACLVATARAETLVSKLTSGGEMLAAIAQAADRHRSTVPERAGVTGVGSKPISPPDQFVLGRKAGDEWVDRRGAVFVWCPPGRFLKGSPPDEPGRYPDETQQVIVIEKGFWISKYEMTLSENLRGRSHKTIATHKNHPLTMVNHDDIRRMTHKTMTEAARKHAGLPDDWQYSLPTETQWEYAARAGTTTMYAFGNDVSQLPMHGNFADKTYYDTGSVYAQHAHRTLSDGAAYLQRVGAYAPNPWGLYDVHGNVAEWCINGAIRGGSWTSTPANCRTAFSQHFSSRNQQNFIGYRLVIQKTPPAK